MSLPRLQRRTAGFTLAETIVASCVALIGMGAAMGLNGAHLRLVKSSRQSNAATLALQERVEQMRLADWRKLTDPAYLKNVLLVNRPNSAAPLGNVKERIVISAYPNPEVADRLIVQRNADGTIQEIALGTGLASQRLAQVELSMAWSGSDDRPRLRATTTVISNGGISKMNLPGIGAPAGALPRVDQPQQPADSGDDDSDGTTPDPDPTPTPEPDNGKGKRRGTVGGKTGQG